MKCNNCNDTGEVSIIGIYKQPCKCLNPRLIQAVKFFGWHYEGKAPEFSIKDRGWKLGNGIVSTPFKGDGIIPYNALDALEAIETHISDFMDDHCHLSIGVGVSTPYKRCESFVEGGVAVGNWTDTLTIGTMRVIRPYILQLPVIIPLQPPKPSKAARRSLEDNQTRFEHSEKNSLTSIHSIK